MICSSLSVESIKAEESVIHIKNAEDLKALANDCRLDTWSQKKVVQLDNDIDLTSVTFEGIPTFGGIFNGNGHTISGASMKQSGSNIGFFRYIQEEGKILNLNINSVVKTAGTKKYLGGFVGRNAGLIKDCSFVGSVEGDSYIGGITGVNETTGKIISSHVGGIMTGEHYVGGIAGQNLGVILKCTNEAKINTNESNTTITLDDLEGIDMSNINKTENTKVRTDIGGIAGFSTGIIEGCENTGNIGYQHIGYNIGGIVGRQSGYISGCHNKGMVYGRKDVGGIVGQMEPYIALEYTKDKVSRLQDELATLKKLMDWAMDDSEVYSSGITTQINKTKSYVDEMISVTDALTDHTEQLYNNGIDSINDLSSRVSETLDKLEPIMTQAEMLGDELSEAIDVLKESVNLLEDTSDEGKKALDHLNTALTSLQGNVGDYTKAIEKLEKAIGELQNAIGDKPAMEAALKKLGEGMSDLAESLGKISTGVSKVADAMNRIKKWADSSEDFKNLAEGLKEGAAALSEMSEAAMKVAYAISKIIKLADSEEVVQALDELEQASYAFMAAGEHLQKALNAYAGGVGELENARKELGEATTEAEKALTNINHALEALGRATSNEELRNAISELEEALSELAKATEKATRASEKISSGIAGLQQSISKDELHDSIEELNQGIKKIAEGISDMSDSTEKIENAISAINNEIRLSSLEDSAELLGQALKALQIAGDHTDSVIEDVKKVVDQTKKTASSGDEVLRKMEKVAESFAAVADTANNMIESTHEIITDLANRPHITFPNLDSDYMGKVNDLTASMGNISDALGGLNQFIGDQNEILLKDLRAVSDQFYKVIDTFIDIAKDQSDDEDSKLDISDFSEDISDEDTEENTQGKVADSINEASVEGDVNVGGIAGAMAIEYDFDPEDDVTKKGDRSFKFQYLARSVIRNCTNEGDITSKKNSVGGIVGMMDLGTVMGCTGCGTITSKDGDFIGGIAGSSYSHIKQSFAMCVLSGKNHVGGIAGYGKRLNGNYAMVDIENAVEYQGAIAGEIEDFNEVKENYFVDRGIAAIDNISYSNKAEPIAYGTFCMAPKLPESFKTLAITFVADGKEVAVIPFAFGESISQGELPEIPKKEGYYGKWPDFDFKHLTFSKTIEAIYVPFTQMVASNEKKENKALALVQGTFGEETVLSVNEADVAPPKGVKKDAILWRVILSGPSYQTEKSYSLRLLAPSNQKFNVYSLDSNGIWTKVDAKRNGSYLIVNMTGDIHVFCLAAARHQKEVILLIGVCIGILLLILIKRRKKKQGGHNKIDKAEENIAC